LGTRDRARTVARSPAPPPVVVPGRDCPSLLVRMPAVPARLFVVLAREPRRRATASARRERAAQTVVAAVIATTTR